MALTGTAAPQGTINTQEDLYLESGPDVYFEDYLGNYRHAPDGDGFYWGLSGTATYPAYKVGCYENFHFKDDVTMNDVRCDAFGVVRTLMKRNFLDVTFDLKSLFPFTTLRHMLKGGSAVTTNASEDSQKFGLGRIDNNQRWKIYFPLIYDQAQGFFVSVTLHKAQFVEGWDWNWQYANSHMINITLRAFFDATRPTGQEFATISRVDSTVF